MTGATWLAIGSLLAAVSPGRDHLSIERCDVDAAEVKRLLRIELDAEILDSAAANVPTASIRCDGARATLAFRSKQRAIDLEKIDPRARPRLIALAIAELAAPKPTPPPPAPPETPSIPERSYEPPAYEPPPDPPPPIEAAPPPPPVAPPPPPPAPEPPPAAIVETPPPIDTSTAPFDLHFAASVMGGITLFTADAPPTFGARAVLEIAPSAFGARFDAGAYYGSKSVDLGSVSLLIADAGLSAFGRFTGGIVLFDVSAGVRAGFARVRGTPVDPNVTDGATITGAWVGPFLGGRSTFRLGVVLIAADVEAGLVIRPVVGRAEGVAVAAADGAWFGFHLGIGLEP